MEHASTGFLVLTFVITALLVGAIIRHLLKNTKIPYTVALLVIGLLFGWGGREHKLGVTDGIATQTIELVSKIDPHLILFVFLPILIFESAFALEVHLFKRTFSQIAILAVPGLIVATSITAVFAYYVFPWDWSWPICFMFGALVSATDPVAVVALLKEVSSRKRLETLIEGESLLNDGTAIVFFTIFYLMVINPNMDFSFSKMATDFIWVVSGGLLIGYALARFAVAWLDEVFNDPMIEISITIICAYFVFLIAEHMFHVSGVVGIVTAALVVASIGRTRVSPEVSEFMHHFWEMMAFFANTIIFLLVGIIVAERIVIDSYQNWIMLGVLYIGLLLIRTIAVLIFMPLLRKISIGFNRQKATVLIWGGLRGAVALALALAVAQDPNISKQVGDQILFLCAGIVVLTILVNGTTMLSVLKLVGLDRLPPAKEITMNKARYKIHEELDEFIPELEHSTFFHEANWEEVKEVSGYLTDIKGDEKIEEDVAHEDIAVAFRRRLLETERKYYWTQFEQSLIGKTATNKLVEAVEHALDGKPKIYPRDDLYQYWQAPKILNLFSKIPGLKKLAVSLSFQNMSNGYDIARGFIYAQKEILKYVSTLAPNKNLEDEVHQEIMQNKKAAREMIEKLRATFPEVLAGIETYAASRIVLNRERHVVHQLVEAGVLDAAEAKKLEAKIESRMQNLKTEASNVSTPDPLQGLKYLTVFNDLSEKTLKAISENVEDCIFSEGTEIIKANSETSSIYIVIRGLIEVVKHYEGKSNLIEMLGPGSLIGVKSLLTKKSDLTYKTSTPLEAYKISIEKLQRIMAEDKQLAEKLAKLTHN